MRGRKPIPTAVKIANGQRDCAACGTPFTMKARAPHARFCSTTCRNRAAYMTAKSSSTKATCRQCGKAVMQLPGAWHKSQHCSRLCAAKTALENRPTIQVTCQHCSQPFTTTSRHRTCPTCARRRMIVKKVRRNARRKAMRRGALGPTHSEHQWQARVGRFNGLCWYCKANPVEHRDHAMPIVRGGIDAIGNIIPACSRCNLRKGELMLSAWHDKMVAEGIINER